MRRERRRSRQQRSYVPRSGWLGLCCVLLVFSFNSRFGRSSHHQKIQRLFFSKEGGEEHERHKTKQAPPRARRFATNAGRAACDAMRSDVRHASVRAGSRGDAARVIEQFVIGAP